MPDHEPVPAIADEVPWPERLTEYDDRHVETYARLLEAANEDMAKDEIARRILGIDPDTERGKGSHITLCYGSRFTIVKDRRKDIGPGLLSSMIRQLGLERRDFGRG